MLCERFNISWTDYGQLTLRERDVLVDILADERKQAERQQRRPHGGPGMERVV